MTTELEYVKGKDSEKFPVPYLLLFDGGEGHKAILQRGHVRFPNDTGGNITQVTGSGEEFTQIVVDDKFTQIAHEHRRGDHAIW